MISVLYVDDEPALLEITRLMLENTRDFTLTTVTSAAEGLAHLRTRPFDAVISDYQMPEMDGIDFLKAVRSEFGDLPFLLFTGKGREEIVIEAINSGADFYVQKGGEPAAQFAELMYKVKSAVERKRSHTALEQSEARYRSVIENIQDVFYRCDHKGTLIMASPSWATLLGYDSVEECIGKNIADTFWMHPVKREAFIEEICDKGKVENYEIVLRRKDGSTVIVSTGSHLYYQSDSDLFGIEGIFRDITARKQAEQRLEESRRLLESIVQGLPLPTFVIDQNCLVISWNRAMEEYSGIPAADMLGTPDARRAFYSSDRPCLADIIVQNLPEEIGKWYSTVPLRSSLINGAYEATEFFPHMKGGVWLAFSAAPLRDFSGTIIGAVEILQDVTAKRKNDEELVSAYSQMQAAFDEAKMSQSLLTEQNWFLNQYEAKYRQIVEASPDMIWEIDPEGCFVYISPQCEQFLGFLPEDLTGSPVFNLVPQGRREEIRETFRDRLGAMDPMITLEIPVLTADGDEMVLEMRALPSRDGQGVVTGLRGVARDITDRKRIEDLLRQEKENFLKIFAAAPVGLLLMRPDRQVIRANGSIIGMVMRDPSEIIGKVGGGAIGCIHSLEDPRGCGFSQACPACPLRLGIETALAKGESIHGERICLELLRCEKPEDVWVSVSIEPVELENRRCVVVAMDDITKSVGIEQALRESESWFREIFNNVNDSIELHELRDDGLPGNYVEVNDVACRMLGYTREELLRRGPLDIATTYHNRSLASIGEDLLKTGHSRFETEHRTRTGQVIPVEVNAHTVTLGGKKRVLSVVRDISQRKGAEKSMHHLRRKIVNLSAITRHDIQHNLTMVGSINTILGKSVEDPRVGDLLNRQYTILDAIARQIEFTREFENVGMNPPRWQAVNETIEHALRALDPGHVKILNHTEPAEIYADPMVGKVFYHLAENALRHGKTLSKLQFSTREHWGALTITCEDDGVGVMEEEKQKILERGYGRHTGLGLYLSQEILSLTGLSIRETGTFGHGARFEIIIPEGAFRPLPKKPVANAPGSPPSAQT